MTFFLVIPLLNRYLKENQIYQKDICTPCFCSTIHNKYRFNLSALQQMNEENVAYIHNGIVFSHKKE